MRVLIFGGFGMLGHKLCQVFRDRFETWATVRSTNPEHDSYGFLDPMRLVVGVDALSVETVAQALATVRPNAVINGIGIIKQLPTAHDPLVSLQVNSLFPHRLGLLCQEVGARVIHISTDCVFSGHKGMYTEDDVPDPEDLYGRSKLLGEVSGSHCLTLRTSFIGRELVYSHGLVEWFLSNRGRRIQGYTGAIFNGFPTLILAQILADVIDRRSDLSGVYHVSTEPISKYRLLCLLREAFQVPVEIEPFPDVSVDRSLDSTRFRAVTGFVPLSWEEMVQTMANDPTPYDVWRQARAF